MRHENFKLIKRLYGAVRVAQSVAAEVHEKLATSDKKNELVGGMDHDAPLNAAEIRKLKALLLSL